MKNPTSIAHTGPLREGTEVFLFCCSPTAVSRGHLQNRHVPGWSASEELLHATCSFSLVLQEQAGAFTTTREHFICIVYIYTYMYKYEAVDVTVAANSMPNLLTG